MHPAHIRARRHRRHCSIMLCTLFPVSCSECASRGWRFRQSCSPSSGRLILAADPRCGPAPPPEMHLNLPARPAACTAGAACRAPEVTAIRSEDRQACGRCALLPPVKGPPTAATPRSRGLQACGVVCLPGPSLPYGTVLRFDSHIVVSECVARNILHMPDVPHMAEGVCKSELREVHLLTSLRMMQHFLTFALF